MGTRDNRAMEALLALKPLAMTLLLPACSGVLFVAVLVALGLQPRGPARLRQAWLALPLFGCLGLWLVASPGMAVWLSRHLLPQVAAVTPQQLQTQRVQAIVVLGGGVESQAAEYQGDTLPADSLARLVYGVYLQRQTQLPMAYSGGVGWAAQDQARSEAEVAALSLERLGAPALHWQEGRSRDTRENAQHLRALLAPQGIDRIALVTHAWHMPRSQRLFEAAGFEVLPAPMGYVRVNAHPVLQWMPSGTGWRDSQHVLREWLASWVQ
jgi:uncharacterized SAM-binding protein YcdF (DUF218 family)